MINRTVRAFGLYRTEEAKPDVFGSPGYVDVLVGEVGVSLSAKRGGVYLSDGVFAAEYDYVGLARPCGAKAGMYLAGDAGRFDIVAVLPGGRYDQLFLKAASDLI